MILWSSKEKITPKELKLIVGMSNVDKKTKEEVNEFLLSSYLNEIKEKAKLVEVGEVIAIKKQLTHNFSSGDEKKVTHEVFKSLADIFKVKTETTIWSKRKNDLICYEKEDLEDGFIKAIITYYEIIDMDLIKKNKSDILKVLHQATKPLGWVVEKIK